MTTGQSKDKQALFTNDSDEWATPQWLFDALDKEFGFTLDPCVNLSGTNAKCARFFTPSENGLLRDWGAEIVFMNPPYSAGGQWMRKAYGAAAEGATVVCLMPARTDTKWFHEYAMKGEIRFLCGRVTFVDAPYGAPFPSLIVIFRPPAFSLASMVQPDGATR